MQVTDPLLTPITRASPLLLYHESLETYLVSVLTDFVLILPQMCSEDPVCYTELFLGKQQKT